MTFQELNVACVWLVPGEPLSFRAANRQEAVVIASTIESVWYNIDTREYRINLSLAIPIDGRDYVNLTIPLHSQVPAPAKPPAQGITSEQEATILRRRVEHLETAIQDYLRDEIHARQAAEHRHRELIGKLGEALTTDFTTALLSSPDVTDAMRAEWLQANVLEEP
jgi:hypothetical protein